jgi:hypothetical protein
MAEQEQQKPRWPKKLREKMRLKKQRTGAPPEKNAERPPRSDGASRNASADRPVIGDITIG